MPVDALLGRSHLHDGVYIENLLLFHQSIDGHGPGLGLEVLG